MKKSVLLVIFALALVSCVREWAPEEVRTEDGLVLRTWTVTMSDETRATLDEALHPVWEKGEKLSVYDHVANVGREFEVTSVDGYKATVSGFISDGGDTPFDAVYPACSAGEWSSDGTNTLKLPEVQVIPEGRNVCPDVLVSTAHSDLPDGTIGFHNISSLLKVKVVSEGIADIIVDLTGSSETDIHSYKAAAEAGTLAPGTYFIAVDPGTYAGGVTVICSDGFGQEYHKSSSNSLEAAVGGIKNLGTVTDGAPWRYYSVTGEFTYSNQDALLEATGLLDKLDASTASMVKPLLGLYFRNRNTPVRAISYTYRSADPQGKPVELSAVVYIPVAALNRTTALAGIALANHGTYAASDECPTEKAQVEAAFAWKNYAIVMSDYYGFGATVDRPQAFLDAETTARGNIDAYLAALQLMKDSRVTIPTTVYNAGYSQGGFNSMANLKYVSQHPELGISFKKTMCGGSPFDVALTWESYLQGGFGRAIGFVPLTVVSMNETQNLGLSYGDLFKGSLLENWEEWILAKKYSLVTLNSKIGTSNLADVMNADFMAGTSAAYNSIMATCRRYSLTSGWAPPGGSGEGIILYHSTEDDTVPYANYTVMKSFLDSVAPGYTAYDGANGGHVEAMISFIIKVLGEW